MSNAKNINDVIHDLDVLILGDLEHFSHFGWEKDMEIVGES